MTRPELLMELVVLSRLLYPKIKVKNPRSRILKLATRKQSKAIQELAEELTQAITKLNQSYRLRKGLTVIESTREDNFNALALLVEQLNPGSMNYKGLQIAYRVIVSHFPDKAFNQRALREQSGYSKTETARHIRQLLYYELIELAGGSRNRGYQYRLKSKEQAPAEGE